MEDTGRQSRRSSQCSANLDATGDHEIHSDDEDPRPLSPDHRTKSAYYNHKIEKQIILTESKHIYQRHALERAQQEGEPQSPLARTSTLSSLVEGELAGRPRSESVASRTTGRDYDNRQRTPSSLTRGSRDTVDSSTGSVVHLRRRPAVGEIPPLVRHHEPVIHGHDINEGVGFALRHTNAIPEASIVCRKIQEVLEIRGKYISLSLQAPKDDPRNDDSWEVYPPPPDPVWYKDKNPPSNPTSSAASTFPEASSQKTSKPRKAGQNIGADFDISHFYPLPDIDTNFKFKLDQNGVYQVYRYREASESQEPIVHVPTLRDYYKDKDKIMDYSSYGPCKTYAFRQLDILDSKFNLHKMQHNYQEFADTKLVPHRDFYNVRKVDTHVHHSSCMNQKHLLRYMKSKMKKSPDEIVLNQDGVDLTLADVFQQMNLTSYDLSIDTLDMHVCLLILFQGLSTDASLGS